MIFLAFAERHSCSGQKVDADNSRDARKLFTIEDHDCGCQARYRSKE